MGDDSRSLVEEHSFQSTIRRSYTFVQSDICTALEFYSASSLFLGGILLEGALHLCPLKILINKKILDAGHGFGRDDHVLRSFNAKNNSTGLAASCAINWCCTLIETTQQRLHQFKSITSSFATGKRIFLYISQT